MSIRDDLVADVGGILKQTWSIRDGRVVPATADIAFAGGGAKLDATILYADLADSTSIAMWDKRVAARLFKSFLSVSSRLIRAHNGEIRSFDGDRAMGVFLGGTKNTSAVKCALKINWAFQKIIKPKFAAQYDAIGNGTYMLSHCTGIDTSEMLVVRGGIRQNNDLVWVGRAPNIAAKLSGFRVRGYHTYITSDVFKVLNEEAKLGGTERKLMWEKRELQNFPVKSVYRSSWTWTP